MHAMQGSPAMSFGSRSWIAGDGWLVSVAVSPTGPGCKLVYCMHTQGLDELEHATPESAAGSGRTRRAPRPVAPQEREGTYKVSMQGVGERGTSVTCSAAFGVLMGGCAECTSAYDLGWRGCKGNVLRCC